jgi:hypothetical protein
MNIIGFDFSLNKPAACVFSNNKYEFFGWPYGLKEKVHEIYREADVYIIPRTDNKETGNNIHEQMRYQVENAVYLANLIRDSLKPYLNRNTLLSFEGLSYASTGANVLQLGGYKYMLMNSLSELVPLCNMFTYTPITVKSVAGCAKKGMGKPEMISAFIERGPKSKLRMKLFEFPEKFQTSKAHNWLVHLDDLVDAYWVLETLRKKENIQ